VAINAISKEMMTISSRINTYTVKQVSDRLGKIATNVLCGPQLWSYPDQIFPSCT
jgi:hypothetical protein